MSLCDALYKADSKALNQLRRNSIYLLGNESDQDFEFFVFVDPDKDDDRPVFLRELRNALFDFQSGLACPENETNFKQLLAKQGITEPDTFVSSLNWLKIYIDNYPYRLFVVIDKDNPDWGGTNNNPIDGDSFWSQSEIAGRKSLFLYKRICWIDATEFHTITSDFEQFKQTSTSNFFSMVKSGSGKELSKESYLKLWLYLHWLKHITHRVRNLQIDSLCIEFKELTNTKKEKDFYFPGTLPKCLTTKKPDKRERSIRFDLKKQKIAYNKSGRYALLYLNRHRNYFSLKNREWSYDGSNANELVVYSENLSGILSYFTRIAETTKEVFSESSLFFIFSLIEAGLFRTLIMDERLQEWLGKRNEEEAGNLIQQRLFLGYLDDPGKYEQKSIPNHKYYSILKVNGKNRSTDPEFILSPEREKAIAKFIENDPSIAGVDVSILHHGILDKWKKSASGPRDAIFKIKDVIPFLLITSGRGVPADLPEGIKFLPYSGLEACLNGARFEKYTLFKQIMSI